jgi:PKD repeat protein
MKRFPVKTIIAVVFLFLSLTVKAQLTADFSITNGEGCIPLKSSFSDLSSGGSSNTTYKWDFGNGNTSTLKSPSSVYYKEGAYTVQLTIKEGSQTSVKTKTVRVYKKPAPDFTFSTVKGCSPLEVTFTSTSLPGDGSISSYFWDFGDGTTQQTFFPTISHTYTNEQNAYVSLTVINQFGCYNTISKNDIIDVLPSLTADFSVDQTVLCRITDEVKFTDKSSGPGTLTYSWDFGDGTTSSQKDPQHVYAQKGIYSIKLTVISSEGCTAVKSLQNFVNVASYKADFNTSTPEVCSGIPAQFSTLSSPAPTKTNWYMGDGNAYNYDRNFHYYYIPGQYEVKLVNSFGSCKDSMVKIIKVKANPVLSGFVDSIGKCGAPAEVKFKDTSGADVVKRAWDFNYNN